MLLPGAKPQVEGSAAPEAVTVCQLVCVPVETVVVPPQGVVPVPGAFFKILYCTTDDAPGEMPLSVRAISEVWPELKLLKLLGSW